MELRRTKMFLAFLYHSQNSGALNADVVGLEMCPKKIKLILRMKMDASNTNSTKRQDFLGNLMRGLC